MATSEFTAHYNLDKYAATDKPNLRDQYNAAMDKIDDALYTANTNATDAKATAQQASQAVSGKASQADLNALSSLLPASQFSAQNTVKETINTLSNKIDENAETLPQTNVLLYGGKPMTRNLNWSEIIATAMQHGEGVYFPAGTYYIDNTVNISGAKFFSVAGCRFIFEGVNSKFNFTDLTSKFYIMGASFFAADEARTGIEVQRYYAHTGVHLIGCFFYGFKDAAFINRNLGIQITSCLFLDCNEGCILATDFTVTNTGFYNCNHAIHASHRNYDGTTLDRGGYSTMLGCQFWVDATAKPNASFVYTQDELVSLAFVGCDFDTTVRLIDARILQGIVIDGCRFLWDNTISGQKACLFYLRGGNYTGVAEVVGTISITNCSFTTPHLDSSASTYEIVAFDGEQNALNFGRILHCYESSGCLLTVMPSSIPDTTGHLFAIPLGFVYNTAVPSQNSAVHYKCAGNNIFANVPSRLIAHVDFAGVKVLHYTTTCKVYFMDSPSDVVQARFGMGSDRFSDVVIGLEYRAINSIHMSGAFRNAYFMNDSSTPSNVSKIKVVTQAI